MHVDCFCQICGKRWDTLDPAVRWLAFDGEWSCVDEVACFTRRTAQQELEFNGLRAVPDAR